MSFGIIGYGSFGKLIASVLGDFGEVWVYSRRDQTLAEHAFVPFEKAASADVVVLAVGLDGLDEVSRKLAGLVKENTLVVDVCSVKMKPSEILTSTLGGKCRILPTHPLFGPQTVKGKQIAGKNIVLCPGNIDDDTKIKAFLKENLKLNVIEMGAEEHDREMAWVHSLTFFVGRGLMKLNPPQSKLGTAYYQQLLDLVELESSHSIELFNTVQRGNPFSQEVRDRFLAELEKINREIQS